MADNIAAKSASSATKSFFGGITGTLGVVVGIIVVLLICCVVAAAVTQMGGFDTDNSSQQEAPNGNSGSANNKVEPTQVEVLTVDTASFIQEFDSNQLASESKYEGKWLQFTGYIDNISEGILGEYYMVINPSDDEYYFGTSIQCFFKSQDSLLSLSNGSQVTLQGKFDTQSFNVVIKECQVVN